MITEEIKEGILKLPRENKQWIHNDLNLQYAENAVLSG